MPSSYNISSGEFRGPDGTLVGTGYAGHPPYVNDPNAIALKDRGPLPPGQYHMATPVNTAPDPAQWPAPTAHLGPLAIPLVPLPQDGGFEWLHGRNGFYIHADLISHPGCGSEGCIVPTKLPNGQLAGHAIRIALAAIREHDDVLSVTLTGRP